MLILLADIGFDVLQSFIDALGFDTLAGRFVGFRIPQFRGDGQFATELRNRTVDGDTAHDGNFTGFLGLTFQIEQDFEGAACHNSNNFKINTLNGVICC